MKNVRVNLAAMLRVEWSAIVAVPDDADLEEVVERFYDEIDGGEFYQDPEYWERGMCWADKEVESDEEPHFRFTEEKEIVDLGERRNNG